jgi:putative spermidine/putrescine transport system substrate-binding protein
MIKRLTDLGRGAYSVVTILTGAVLLFGAVDVATAQGTPRLQGQKIVLYTYGGSYLQALKDIVIQPFEKATGATIVIDDSCCAKLPAAMEAKEFIGDVTIGHDRGEMLAHQAKGWLLKDDRLAKMAKDRGIPERLQSPNMVTLYLYTYLMASSDPNAPMPQTWAEFWDVQKFPGARGLIRDPFAQMEAALLADGVAPANLYPINADRAFAKLDQLRKATKVLFAETGAQQINLLATKEVAYSMAYSNRVILAANEGIKLGSTYSQGFFEANGGAILRGAKNVDGAVALLEFHLRPDVSARVAERTGLAPAYAESAQMISEARRPLMPSFPANFAKQIPANDEYWQANRDKLYERWVQWLAQ